MMEERQQEYQCNIHSSGLTHVGCVRSCNEDAYLEMPDSGLWCVADGMGGHQAGDLASQRIVDVLADLAHRFQGPALLHRIKSVLQMVNTELRETAKYMGSNVVIGSTVVVLLLEGEHYHCFWTGDSRCYLWRNQQLQCITRDHTAVSEALEMGYLTAEEAYRHKRGNVLTQAIGAFDEFFVEVEQGILYENDTFLLCTDGLTKVFSDQMIADRMQARSISDINTNLINEAVSLGAKDNLTSVMLSVEGI